MMRSRRSRKAPAATAAASFPPAGNFITDPSGSAGMSSGTRRTSSRVASAATRSAAATDDGARTSSAKSKGKTTAMKEPQQQAPPQNPEQTQSGRRSVNTRKRTRTTFYTAEVGTEKSTRGAMAKAGGAAEAAATAADGAASRSSEAQSDTAGGAISDNAANGSGDSSGGKAQKANSNAFATAGRTSRLSLTKRRAARAQAQAKDKTKAHTQTKKKDQVQGQPSPGRTKGQKYRVGTVISKDFDGVAYRGEILSYDAMARYYKVRYVEDGDEEELEEAEIERFLDPLDCSSDADSSIAVSVTAAVTSAVTTAGKKSSADEPAIESEDVAAAKPEGKTRDAAAAAAAAAAQEDAVTAKSADRGKGDKAAATKDGPKKNRKDRSKKKDQKISAPYPIGTEISKDFDGVAYRGEVISYDEGSKFYKIRYSDGDEEEMDAKDMTLHVVHATGRKTDDTGAATKNDNAKKADAKKSDTKVAASSEIDGKAGGDAGAGAKKGGGKKANAKKGDAKKAASTEVGRKVGGDVGTSDSADDHSGVSSDNDGAQKSSKSANKGGRSKEGKKSDKVKATKPSDPPNSSGDDILRAATQLAVTKTPVSATGTSMDTTSKKSDGEEEEKETFHPGHVCRDAQFYTTLNDETPFDCSEKLGCECNDLLSANRKRYKRLNAKSKLQQGTILQIPEKRDVEKVLHLYKYEDGEPKLDYCYVCLEIESPDGPEMLLCDGDSCDKACHLSCTHDKLNAIPDGDWYCKSCQDKSSTSISSKPKKDEKKKRSKLKRISKASRSKGSGTRTSASSSTPNLYSVRPVTPASYDVMDSLAFLGQSTAPASALVSAPLSSKSRSTKSKQKQRQTKSPPRPKTPKDQESILSSPVNLPSKKLLAVLDGQVVEDSTTSDVAHMATTTERSAAKKMKGAATTGSKKKRGKNKDYNNSTSMDSIALTVEEEFKRFERTRLKGERQTIVLRIRRLKEEITSLQDQGKAAAAKKGGEKPESALSRTKKITWKQLELKNLQGEEKRLTNRLDELSENASSLSSTIEEGNGSDASVTAKPSSSDGKAIEKKKARRSTNGKEKKGEDTVASDAPTKATANDVSTIGGIDSKKHRSSSNKRKQPLGTNSSDDENTESDGQPKTKAKKKAKTSAKKTSAKKGLSDIQRKRDQARRKRKELKLSRRSSKSNSTGDNDDGSDEDYSQVWVNNDASDSEDHNLPPDMSPDEPPPKKKKRQSRRQSGSSTGRGRGSKPLWLPCGSCLGCIQTKDCGRCRSCLERPSEATSLRSAGGFQRFICIQRQCLAPTHRGKSSGNGDDVDSATPTPAATDVSSASQEKDLPQLSGGVKRKNMPALGGVKNNTSPLLQPEIPIADEAQPRVSKEEHIDEIESLSDGGEGMFNMSDLEDDDGDDDEALGLNPRVVGTLNAGLVDMAPPPLHAGALPPVPQQVTVPSPLRGKEGIAGAIPPHSAVGNAAQMARDLRRRDRSNYDDDGADEWSSVGGSLGSHGGDEMMELPPL